MKARIVQLLLCMMSGALTLQVRAGDFDQQLFAPSNMGMEFYFSFIPMYEVSGNNKLMLYIASTQKGYATIEVVDKGFKSKVVLVANATVPVEIGPGNGQAFSQAINNGMPVEQVYPGAAIHITSTVPSAVIAVTRFSSTSESFLALPVQSLGSKYVCASMPDMSWMYNSTSLSSVVAIVGAYDNTTVQFTLGGPSVTKTAGGMTPGQTKRFSMNNGDVWIVGNDPASNESDLTGSFISSSKPVAVISGNQCANVPTNVPWCDFIQEQQLPINQWGQHYLLPKYEERRYGFYEKVFSADTNCSILRNGQLWKTLQTVGGQEGRGWIYDRAASNNESVALRSTKPIAVSLFNPGQTEDSVVSDPFQMNVMPWEQFSKSYMFSTPGTSSGINFTKNYVGVLFPLTSKDSIPDDLEFGSVNAGVVTWEKFKTKFGSVYPSANIYSDTMPNASRYAYKECLLSSDGVYALRCSKPIMVYSYGTGTSESYGHPAACLNLDLQHSTDTIAPLIVDTLDAGDFFHGLVTDLPSDPAIRSNLSKVMLSAESFNCTLDYDPFQAGAQSSTKWRVLFDDYTQDAFATLVCSDAAGNISKKTFSYTASDVVVPFIQAMSTATLCVGDSILLKCPNASIFRSVTWSNGATTPQIWFTSNIAKDTTVGLVAISTTGKTRLAIPYKLRFNAKPPMPTLQHVLNVLSAPDTPYDSTSYYQWFLDGIAIPGATSLTCTVGVTGSYALKVTNAAGCSTFSEPVIVKNIVSVEQPSSTLSQIQLNPNPAKNICVLHYPELSQLSVDLFNERGVLVRHYNSNQIPEGALEISLESLAAGVYSVQLHFAHEVHTMKLIKD